MPFWELSGGRGIVPFDGVVEGVFEKDACGLRWGSGELLLVAEAEADAEELVVVVGVAWLLEVAVKVDLEEDVGVADGDDEEVADGEDVDVELVVVVEDAVVVEDDVAVAEALGVGSSTTRAWISMNFQLMEACMMG